MLNLYGGNRLKKQRSMLCYGAGTSLKIVDPVFAAVRDKRVDGVLEWAGEWQGKV